MAVEVPSALSSTGWLWLPPRRRSRWIDGRIHCRCRRRGRQQSCLPQVGSSRRTSTRQARRSGFPRWCAWPPPFCQERTWRRAAAYDSPVFGARACTGRFKCFLSVTRSPRAGAHRGVVQETAGGDNSPGWLAMEHAALLAQVVASRKRARRSDPVTLRCGAAGSVYAGWSIIPRPSRHQRVSAPVLDVGRKAIPALQRQTALVWYFVVDKAAI